MVDDGDGVHAAPCPRAAHHERLCGVRVRRAVQAHPARLLESPAGRATRGVLVRLELRLPRLELGHLQLPRRGGGGGRRHGCRHGSESEGEHTARGGEIVHVSERRRVSVLKFRGGGTGGYLGVAHAGRGRERPRTADRFLFGECDTVSPCRCRRPAAAIAAARAQPPRTSARSRARPPPVARGGGDSAGEEPLRLRSGEDVGGCFGKASQGLGHS
mmetsp:Transcript_33649/g.84693  ORF Transcript_33649/g.84693 Transcript_33649/m.84693 type:complete len:216 (+) Transcript_33649:704-1351(+)